MTPDDQKNPTPKSFLIADCGSTNTTVALFDIANGNYRLLAKATAPTTLNGSEPDITRGIQQAATRISEVTGRTLLNEQGALIRPSNTLGVGVDQFTAVISAAPPLKTLLVGLFDDVSLASARRAMSNSYVLEVDSISLSDTRDEAAQINGVIAARPDLIFIVGGTDGGAQQRPMSIIQTVSLGLGRLTGRQKPPVLFAGNINMREPIRKLLGDEASLQVASNVRPTLDSEQLDQAFQLIRKMYEEVKVNQLPGVAKLREWSTLPVTSTAQAFATITEYFAALQGKRVIGLDLGSNSATFVVSDPDRTHLSIRSDLGMGRPIANLLSHTDTVRIGQWIHSEIEADEVEDLIQQKHLFPESVPMTEKAQLMEQAVARQILETVVSDAISSWKWTPDQLAPFNLLLVRGATLVNVSRPGQAIRMLLDAIQPTGFFSVALDQHGVLPALGALAPHDPLAVVQALEGGVLVDLGWVVAIKGKGQPGKKALTVVLETDEVKQLTLEVPFGSMELLPIAPGQSATITLSPERGVDIGFGPGNGKKMKLLGGKLGLVIDARGRPLTLPQEEDSRLDTLRRWSWGVGAQ